jgi:probable phosphoglycerate mutase
LSDTDQYRQHRWNHAPDTARILLCRHGESEPARPDTPFPLVDGHGDPALHENGQRQAAALGERLAAMAGVSTVYVTTLRRTVQTAAPFLQLSGLRAEIEPDLREVFLGDWEGGELRVRAAAGDPIFAEVLTAQRWDVIPGAEPLDAFSKRTSTAIERIAERHPGETVAVFTHGGVIGQVVADVVGVRGFAFAGADNASITEIAVSPERKLLRRFNDTAHLENRDEIDA